MRHAAATTTVAVVARVPLPSGLPSFWALWNTLLVALPRRDGNFFEGEQLIAIRGAKGEALKGS